MTTLHKSTSALALQLQHSTLKLAAKLVKKKYLLPFVGSFCLSSGVFLSEFKQYNLDRDENLKQSEALGTCYDKTSVPKTCNAGKPSITNYTAGEWHLGSCPSSSIEAYPHHSVLNDIVTTPLSGFEFKIEFPWPCNPGITFNCIQQTVIGISVMYEWDPMGSALSDDTHNKVRLFGNACDETGQ
jgi:hypothetical protein